MAFAAWSKEPDRTMFTESEWLNSTDINRLLAFIRNKASQRKLRLLACGIARQVDHLLVDPRSREAVEIAEKYADGKVSRKVLLRSRRAAREAHSAADEAFFHELYPAREALPVVAAARIAAVATAEETFLPRYMNLRASFGDLAYEVAQTLCRGAFDDLVKSHCALVRDLFGNPFRPITINSIWLTPTVLALAQAAYEERIMPSGELDPARLAVLSDALEESGCDNHDILIHLRSPGPHVRGCWALDLLLGKE